jgi:hypothetical protein
MGPASERPSEQSSAASDTPVLRVVNADATAEEIAALVAVFCAPRHRPLRPKGFPSEWPVSTRLRSPLDPRPGGWRAGSLPR